MIKSVSYNQQEILNNIITLYCPNGIEVDCCYSKGVFYKNGVVAEPKYKFDINPQTQDTQKCDCRELPFEDNSVDSIIFDPPFLATTGKSLKSSDANNIINKRFGVYESEQKLYDFYKEAIVEFKRVLKPNGILIVKSQDKVSSGKQYITHNYIINECRNNGLLCEDIFILIAKNRIVADWQLKNQQHARKFHSYFMVFRKNK